MFVEAMFRLTPDREAKIREYPYQFGFDGFGELTYYRTYSRKKENGTQENWYDTIIRVINGIMSIRKDWCAKMRLPWNERYYQDYALEMALSAIRMEWLPPGRGLFAMGTNYMYERGSSALQNCFSGSEKFLTKEYGLKTFSELVGESVEVLTAKGWKKAKVKSFGFQPLQRVTLKPLSGLNGRTNLRKVVTVTPNHRWILNDGSETTDLKVGDLVPHQVSEWDEENLGYKKGFVHGLIFADGSMSYDYKDRQEKLYQIRLCGKKAQYANLFEWTTYPPSYNGEPLSNIRSVMDLKELPPGTCGPDYLAGFLKGWIAGDGCLSSRRGNGLRLDTQNAEAAAWAMDYAFLAGYLVSGHTVDARDTNFGPRQSALHRLVFSDQDICRWEVKSIEPLDEEEEVYCAVVEDEHAFTLSGGVYTGNCGASEVNNKSLDDDVAWIADMLMQGVGVGFECISGEITLKPQSPGEKVRFQIPDSREGWVDSIRMLLRSFMDGTPDIEYDYSLIRDKGLPIRGFGGTASGSEPLKLLHQQIRELCNLAISGRIDRTRFVADLCNLVGCMVVAGNVRRCLPEGALVTVPSGRVPIEFLEVGDEVLTAGGYKKVKAKFFQGKQRLVRISTLLGFFECTANHRMAVFVGPSTYTFKQASELTSSDYLVLNGLEGDELISQEIQYSQNTVGQVFEVENYALNLIPAQVVSVSDSPKRESLTWDIEVEDRHEFFCNDYLTHNSAQICVGDPGDDTLVNLKNYELYPERQAHGWMSNNSIRITEDGHLDILNDVAHRIRDNGEPGVLNMLNTRMYGRYGEYREDYANLYNPCLTADTYVAVADGRLPVTIKKLADEGKDVDVYTLIDGKLAVRKMRNPRLTGESKEVYKVKFSDGTFIRCTGNHKFLLRDGTEKEALSLKKGDSLESLSIFGYKKKGLPAVKVANVNEAKVYRLLRRGKWSKSEHRFLYGVHNPDKSSLLSDGVKFQIHHKDHDPSNNRLDNLEFMSAKEHSWLHRSRVLGKKNPVHKMDFQTRSSWVEKLRDCSLGENNPNFSGISNEDLISQVSAWVLELGDWPTKRDYLVKAEETGWPKGVSSYRKKFGITSINVLIRLAAIKAGVEYSKRTTSSDVDRQLGYWKSQTDLPLIVLDGSIFVQRECEWCTQEFLLPPQRREQSFCSQSCGNEYSNTNPGHIANRRKGQKAKFEARREVIRNNQVDIFLSLQTDLERDPMRKEWELACKEAGISSEIGRKGSPFRSWKLLKEAAMVTNHRVVSVDYDGVEDVYNGTVDESHVFFSIGSMRTTSDGHKCFSFVAHRQCGEQPLENKELCTLVETFPARCRTEKAFYRACEFATFYASTVTLLPTNTPETNAVMQRNRRIGVSISGVADWIAQIGYGHIERILHEAYALVRRINLGLAREAGVPESIRVTTVKPGGTVPIVAGSSSGMNYPPYLFAIRRIRVGEHTPIADFLLNSGMFFEPDLYSKNTLVFSFPIKAQSDLSARQVSAYHQFQLLECLQRDWSDNAVSTTIYYDPETESHLIGDLLREFVPKVKSVSMLPHTDEGVYPQSPYQGITEEEYREMRANLPEIDWRQFSGSDGQDERYCTTDKCEFIPRS